MKFFQLIPSGTNFDFIGKFKYFIIFSIVSGIAVVYSLAKGHLNYGIDFTGGTVLQVEYKQPTHVDTVRATLDKLGEHEATVAALGTTSKEYLISVRSVEEKTNKHPLNKRLVEEVGKDNLEVKSMDLVGPKVGKELKNAALLSLFYTVLLIMIYIWLRFDFRFAPGATVAMVHDLLLTSGFYILTGREFTITAVAALLTIAGYSVNDTIVVYDRVREMIKKGADTMPLPKLINNAINITLSRTVLTSTITLISIVPLIFFTKGEIQSFAIAMCFGIFVGTYSTVYIASPLTIYVERYLGKKGKGMMKGKTVTV